jgi:hypothetical protein
MPSMLSRFFSVVVASLALAMHSGVAAATAQGNFLVTVNLAGICISSALSQQTNALVRVTCQGNQFVSIEQRDGKPFVGTHGGAHRYIFNKTTAGKFDFSSLGNLLEDRVGQGTITALRVLDLTETDERLELLVSF